MTVRIVLDPTAVTRMLNDPDGAVAKDLQRRALNVESQAKLNFGPPRVQTSLGPGPNVDTGRLRSSITHEIVTRPDGGLVARVGSNVEYARYVEMGTDRAPPYPYLRPALSAARV